MNRLPTRSSEVATRRDPARRLSSADLGAVLVVSDTIAVIEKTGLRAIPQIAMRASRTSRRESRSQCVVMMWGVGQRDLEWEEEASMSTKATRKEHRKQPEYQGRSSGAAGLSASEKSGVASLTCGKVRSVAIAS